VRGARLAFVAETRAEAEAEAAVATEIYFGALGYRAYHAEAVAEGRLPPTAATPAERRRQLDFFVGPPDEVAELLNAHIEATGIDRLDVMAQLPGLEPAAVRRSLTLINKEVRPRLRLNARPATLFPSRPHP
jgi:alkanesulfonate monooxygenase SsuD/methylene tetrahydromethanopterin reductase-like flavin-dependent oxidoreductase (luciferase family)